MSYNKGRDYLSLVIKQSLMVEQALPVSVDARPLDINYLVRVPPENNLGG